MHSVPGRCALCMMQRVIRIWYMQWTLTCLRISKIRHQANTFQLQSIAHNLITHIREDKPLESLKKNKQLSKKSKTSTKLYKIKRFADYIIVIN
jgi:hypothetical protein